MRRSPSPPPSFNTDHWEKLLLLKEKPASLVDSPSLTDSAPKHNKGQKLSPPSLTQAHLSDLNTDVSSASSVQQENLKEFALTPKKPWLEKTKEYQAILNWLCQTFPQTFDTENPKPLKTNIVSEIYPLLPEDGSISKIKLRATLQYYTRSPAYLRAVVEHSHRVDLKGQTEEAILEAHKEFSQTLQEQRQQKRQERLSLFKKQTGKNRAFKKQRSLSISGDPAPQAEQSVQKEPIVSSL